MKTIAVSVIALLTLVQSVHAQCLSGNCYDGIGTYLYPSGARYSGHFRKGKIHGYGRLVFSDGRIYEGEWRNHYREGKGVMYFPKGDVYRGDFKHSEFYGFGTMHYANGDVYKGAWKKNYPNGKGVLSYHNGDRYEGDFRAGKLHGKGVMYYHNGDKYDGYWKSNKKEGPGKFYLTNGQVIVGFWSDGKYVGREQPQVVVETQTTAGSAGQTSENISALRDCNTIHCASGRGKYTYSDGSVYIGDFHNGIPQGQGTCYYPNGDKYVGDWGIAGPEGQGTYYFDSGRVAEGLWSAGRLVKTKEEMTPVPVPDGSKVVHDPAVRLWAVVIGAADYKYIHPLKYTDDDAYRFYSFIKSPEGGSIPDSQVRLLINEEATRQKILDAMNDVFGKADDNDIVMLYYSGHGLRGCFLPTDYNGFQNKLRHNEVTAILNASRARHKIVLADACYSGSMVLAEKSAPVTAEDAATRQRFYAAFDQTHGGTAVLLSSQADEVSLEDQGLHQGVYTYFLIKGLKGEADFDRNKIVEVDELYKYMKTNIHNYTAGIQTPVLVGRYDHRMPIAVVR